MEQIVHLDDIIKTDHMDDNDEDADDDDDDDDDDNDDDGDDDDDLATGRTWQV